MRKTKHWLVTAVLLLCSISVSAVSTETTTFPDWTSDNQGKSNSTSSETYLLDVSSKSVLTFSWLVSSESNYDKLIITLDGVEIINESGEKSGVYEKGIEELGTHTLVVKYTKDGSANKGSDYATVYGIVLGNDVTIVTSGSCGSNLGWMLTDEGELIIEGTGGMYDYSSSCYPWFNYRYNITKITVKDGVTSIEERAFYNFIKTTSITIPNSVISIGDGAFYQCVELTSIDLPDGLTTIGAETFCDCSNLVSITIPESVVVIGNFAFEYCNSLASVTMPNGMKKLGNYAFRGCSSLTSVTIPEGVTSIGYGVFSGCDNLASIVVEDGNIKYDSRNDCNAIIKTSTNTLIQGCSTTIIPESVISVGYNAFNDCNNLTAIEIPESVVNIEDYAFSGCESLANINVSKNLISVGGNAFSNTAWYDAQPNGLVYVGMVLYKYKGAMPENTTVELKEGTTGITAKAFYDCVNLASIIIHESIISVGEDAFSNTAWYDAQPDGLIYVGKTLYKYKGTMPENTSIEVNEGTREIVASAFSGSKGLISISMPESVTSIGQSAFSGCSNLTSINIPRHVVWIGGSAFSKCSNLTSINIPDGVTSLESNVFDGCSKLADVNISEDSKLTSIGSYAFWNCSNLPSINIPMEMVEIKHTAFSGCKSLVSVNIPESVVEIGDNAFAGCSNLTSINIPDAVTKIEDYTFYSCNNLASIVIPADVKSIGEYAFYCQKLYSITCKASFPPVCRRNYSATYWRIFWDTSSKRVLLIPVNSTSSYQSAECWSEFVTVEAMPLDNMTIIDGEDFVQTINQECANLNYTRTFNNTNWQALYVPFEIPYENIKDDFEVAYINDTRQYDRDDDGVKEETVIEAFKITSGTLEANYPYLIRAKEVGEKTITVTDAILYATEENSIDCSSVYDKYTFTGTYSRMSRTELTGCYALSGGVWQPIAEGATLGAFRFYLQVESRGGSAQAAQSIKMRVIGEETDDEATSIDEVESADNEQIVYDLAGRRMANPTKGVYIVNGKKMLYN